jgi:hypothetical protein
VSESPYVYLFANIATIGLYLGSACIIFDLSAAVVFEGPVNIKLPVPV